MPSRKHGIRIENRSGNRAIFFEDAVALDIHSKTTAAAAAAEFRVGLMNGSARVIKGYVHNGSIGVLVEFAIESDFTLRVEAFVELANEIVLHVAACAPASPEELLQQPFVKDPSVTVGQLLASVSAKLRESLAVTRLVRWDTSDPQTSHTRPPSGPAVAMRQRSV